MSSENKCEHGQKITTFCATDCCVWKEAGGCPSCIRKYHNHMGPTLLITQEQIHKLIKLYNVDASIKPNGRFLQQSILSYFNTIKTQITTLIDNACSDIINQIGHPFLTSQELMSTYKRIKKKHYRKILQKEFRNFYEESVKIQGSKREEFIQKQKKLYLENVKKKGEFLAALEKAVKGLEKLNQDFGVSYMTQHNSNRYKEIADTIKKVLKGQSEESHRVGFGSPSQYESPTRNTNNTGFNLANKLEKVESEQNKIKSQFTTPQNNKSYSPKLEQTFSPSPTAISKKNKQKSPQETPPPAKPASKQNQISDRDPERNRINSLDKHFTKSNKLQTKKVPELNDISIKIKDDNKKDNQTLFLPPAEEQFSPRRQKFNSKEVEINEKKQKLLEMMGGTPNRSTKQQNTHQQTNKYAGKQTENKKEKGKDSIYKKKSEKSGGSMQSIDQREDKMQFFAHTVLPRSESRRKIYEQVQQIAQRTIILPVEEENTKDEAGSPTKLKHVVTNQGEKMSKREQNTTQLAKKAGPKPINNGANTITSGTTQSSNYNKQASTPNRLKNSTEFKLAEKQKNQHYMELSDKQEKSIALLIKSLTLKPEQAIPLVEKALEYCEDNLSAAEYLSYVLLQTNRTKQCITICNKMLEKLAGTSNTMQLSFHFNINKCAAFNKVGRYSQSIVILEQCVKFRHNNARLLKNLADAYYSIGNFEKSNYYYEKAVTLEDSLDEAHYNLAVSLFVQENYHNAKFAIMKALHHSPRNQIYLQLQKEINLRIKQF